jgi:hypothetical protein
MMQQNVFVWPVLATLCPVILTLLWRLSLIIFFWLAFLAVCVCVGASDVFPRGGGSAVLLFS